MADEAVAEPVVEAEGAEVEAPSAEGVESPPVEAAPWEAPEGLGEKYQSWGVEVNDLDNAVGIYKALQSEQGVIDLVVEGLRSLGFGVKDIERFLNDETDATPAQAKAAAEAPELDPDEPLTRAQLEAILEEKVTGPQQRDREAQQVATAQQAIGNFFQSKAIEDPKSQEAIRAFGKQYLPDGDFDPSHVQAALEKGYQDWEGVISSQAEAYLARKAGDTAKIPTPVAGHVGAGDGSDRPDYKTLGKDALNEARKRVRAQLAAADEG